MKKNSLFAFLFGALVFSEVSLFSKAETLVSAVFVSKTDLSRPREDKYQKDGKTTTTGDKDFDSAVSVSVVLVEGITTTLLAEIKGADSRKTYFPGEEHRIDLVVKNFKATYDGCANAQFKFSMKAVGNDYWRLSKASVVLTFDNGKTIVKCVECPTAPGTEPGDSEKDLFVESTRSQLVEKGYFPEDPAATCKK
jgi:hypothetical protein